VRNKRAEIQTFRASSASVQHRADSFLFTALSHASLAEALSGYMSGCVASPRSRDMRIRGDAVTDGRKTSRAPHSPLRLEGAVGADSGASRAGRSGLRAGCLFRWLEGLGTGPCEIGFGRRLGLHSGASGMRRRLRDRPSVDRPERPVACRFRFARRPMRVVVADNPEKSQFLKSPPKSLAFVQFPKRIVCESPQHRKHRGMGRARS